MLYFPVLLWAMSCVLISLPFNGTWGWPVSALLPPQAQPPPREVPAEGLPTSRHRNWKGPPLPAHGPPRPGPRGLRFYTLGAHLPGKGLQPDGEGQRSTHHVRVRALVSHQTRQHVLTVQDAGSVDALSCWLEKCADTKFHSTPDAMRATISLFLPDLQLNIHHLTDLTFLITESVN